MPIALVLRHVAFEHLGVLAPVLAELGYAVRYHEVGAEPFDEAAVAAAELLVVLGGPIGVYDDADYPFLRSEVSIIGRRLAAGGRTLGICLGAQLMAAALGARVAPGGTTELGFFADLDVSHDPLLADFAGLEVLQWHGDTFELPEGARRLASSSVYSNQAFAVGEHGLALQFHPEVDPPMLEQWLIGNVVELGRHGVGVAALRARGASACAPMNRAAERLLRSWLGSA